MREIKMYTDGSCSGNPGPAGWAAILEWERGKITRVAGEADSTNNRAEINAVIIGLEQLFTPCHVIVYTDSQYVIGVMSKGWKRKANHDLLLLLDRLCAFHEVEFVHVKGHDGNPGNEEADALAKAEVQRQISSLSAKAMLQTERRKEMANSRTIQWSPWAIFYRGHGNKLLYRHRGAETQDVLIKHTPWTGNPETEEEFDKLEGLAESLAITNERVETEWPY